jgi:hypothetical protein
MASWTARSGAASCLSRSRSCTANSSASSPTAARRSRASRSPRSATPRFSPIRTTGLAASAESVGRSHQGRVRRRCYRPAGRRRHRGDMQASAAGDSGQPQPHQVQPVGAHVVQRHLVHAAARARAAGTGRRESGPGTRIISIPRLSPSRCGGRPVTGIMIARGAVRGVNSRPMVRLESPVAVDGGAVVAGRGCRQRLRLPWQSCGRDSNASAPPTLIRQPHFVIYPVVIRRW